MRAVLLAHAGLPVELLHRWVGRALSPEAEKGGGEAWELRGPGEGGAWGVARGMRRGAWWARTLPNRMRCFLPQWLVLRRCRPAWNCSLFLIGEGLTVHVLLKKTIHSQRPHSAVD